jgi:hypothetical protein
MLLIVSNNHGREFHQQAQNRERTSAPGRDKASTSGQPERDTPLTAENVRDIVQSISDRITESRTQIREYAAADLVKLLGGNGTVLEAVPGIWALIRDTGKVRTRIVRDALGKHQETIWTALTKNIKRKASSLEVVTCSKALVMFLITMEWVEREDIYKQVYELLRPHSLVAEAEIEPNVAAEVSKDDAS